MDTALQFTFPALRITGQTVYGRDDYGVEGYGCAENDQVCITESGVPQVPNTGFLGMSGGTVTLVSGILLLVVVAVGVIAVLKSRKRHQKGSSEKGQE